MRKENRACGLCEFGDTKKFLYLYVTIGGNAPQSKHVQHYLPGLERCSLTMLRPKELHEQLTSQAG